MANFRTTADLLDGVLRRCGEITSDIGVSKRQNAALLYLNQVHHTIISGGNELGLDVDEPWIWARSRDPIIIQLNPSITTGTVSFVQGSTTGTFSAAPTVNGVQASIENWMIRPQGFPDTYRISSHVSGSTTFSIDGPYPQATNASLNFSAFQIDYDLVASSININSLNDTLDFSEDGTSTITASVARGGYTPQALATAVAAALTASSVQGNTYSGSYDAIQRLFTFTSNGLRGSIFRIFGASTNFYRSAWSTLGFDYNNTSGSLSYTGIYALSGIIRLTQPARIYYGQQFLGGSGRGQVGGMDVVSFDSQYPLSSIKVGTPEAFCVIQERSNATLKVRFNRYLDTTHNMRVEFDHVPQPKDLYNNTASIPIFPRKFIRILEYGASYFLSLDKQDSQADSYLQISQAALTAMIRQNRRELERTGLDFGSVLARPDLMPSKKRNLRLNFYGYDSGSY